MNIVFALIAVTLSLKLSLEVELLKSKQIHSTFSPNQLDQPVEVHFSKEPKALLKLKVEGKSGDLLKTSQVLLALKGPDRQTMLFTTKGLINTIEINAKSFKDGEYLAAVYVQDPELGNVEYPFGKFEIVSGNDQVEDDYSAKKELFHTFRKDVEEVDPLIPNIFVGLTVVLPWLLLLGMWGYLNVNISNYTSSFRTIVTSTIFLITLALSLLLFHAFWLKLNLFQLFSYGVPIWALTGVTGRYALQTRALRKLN